MIDVRLLVRQFRMLLRHSSAGRDPTGSSGRDPPKRGSCNSSGATGSVGRAMSTSTSSAFLRGHERPGRGAHAGVVHAPGRPQPARVPGTCAGPGSILEAIKQPDLAAEITLQPVRRYGVDAAVLYSDIVVPAHAVGSASTSRPAPARSPPTRCGRPPTSAGCGRSSPDDIGYVTATVERLVAELGADVPVLAFAGAPFTVASYLVEGRPSRTYEHTKALMHTDRGALARADGTSGGDGGRVRRRPAHGRCAGVPAVRLVGRRTLAAPTTTLRAAALAAGVRRARRTPSRGARHPLRDRMRPPPRGDVRRPARRSSGSTGGPRSRDARRRLGADVVVQGNLDPALVLAGDRRRPRRRPTGCSPTTPATPATCSTSATACTRPPTPACCAAIVDLVPRAARCTGAVDGELDATTGVVLMAYGTPRRRRRDRALLHRHPPRAAADGRAARRPHPPLRRHRRHLPARRRTDGRAGARAAGRARRASPRASTSSASG